MTGRRAAVLGKPIAHSLSPVLHTAAYRALGLDLWSYDRFEVAEDQLADFLDSCGPQWAGLSLTMPLKQRIMELMDQIDPLAQAVGAVNTVLFTGPGGAVRVGANTDVYGIVAALREVQSVSGDAFGSQETHGALVLGAGATAASALAALGELGQTQPTVAVRSLARTVKLRAAAHRMGVEPKFITLSALESQGLDQLVQARYVISTLPAHAADPLAQRLAGTRIGGTLLDVVYDPRPSELLTAWRAGGGAACGGERMLLHQAGEQVRLMTGLNAPIEAMHSALQEHL